MKFLKEDGSVEDGIPLTEELVEQMAQAKSLVHAVVCKYANHYDWHGHAACVRVATAIAKGATFHEAIKSLVPQPDPAPTPVREPLTIPVIEPPPSQTGSVTIPDDTYRSDEPLTEA